MLLTIKLINMEKEEFNVEQLIETGHQILKKITLDGTEVYLLKVDNIIFRICKSTKPVKALKEISKGGNSSNKLLNMGLRRDIYRSLQLPVPIGNAEISSDFTTIVTSLEGGNEKLEKYLMSDEYNKNFVSLVNTYTGKLGLNKGQSLNEIMDVLSRDMEFRDDLVTMVSENIKTV